MRRYLLQDRERSCMQHQSHGGGWQKSCRILERLLADVLAPRLDWLCIDKTIIDFFFFFEVVKKVVRKACNDRHTYHSETADQVDHSGVCGYATERPTIKTCQTDRIARAVRVLRILIVLSAILRPLRSHSIQHCIPIWKGCFQCVRSSCWY